MSTAAIPHRKDEVVADVMSRPVLTVEVGESLWDAWQLLFVSGLRHLVVIDGNPLEDIRESEKNVKPAMEAVIERKALIGMEVSAARICMLACNTRRNTHCCNARWHNYDFSTFQ